MVSRTKGRLAGQDVRMYEACGSAHLPAVGPGAWVWVYPGRIGPRAAVMPLTRHPVTGMRFVGGE